MQSSLNPNAIGKRLTELRKEAGMTQAQVRSHLESVDHQLSCSKVTYSSYENGKTLLPTGTLFALSDLYGVSTDYILCKSDYTKPENHDIGAEIGIDERNIEFLKTIHSESDLMERALNHFLSHPDVTAFLFQYALAVYDAPANQKSISTIPHVDGLSAFMLFKVLTRIIDTSAYDQRLMEIVSETVSEINTKKSRRKNGWQADESQQE